MAYDVIVSGHLCADLLPDTSSLPLTALSSPGKLFEVGGLDIATGGSVSNTGLALHRLGIQVGLMTTVGDDLLGRVIIAKLKDHAPHLSDLINVRPNEASSYSVILSPENADRIILHCAGNNRHFGTEDVDFELASQSKIFHLGYPPLLPRLYENDGERLRDIFQRLYAQPVITSMDMALPDPHGPSGQVNWVRVLETVLPYVDIFLPSLEEIVFMLRREDYVRWGGHIMENIDQATICELGEQLVEMGVMIAGIKLGAYGFYLRTSDNSQKLRRLTALALDAEAWRNLEVWQPSFAVQVAGTTGAGDSAYGGFLAALLHRLDPVEAVRMACAVGACNVEAVDATSGVRSWDETVSRIRDGWQTVSRVLQP